MGPQVIHSGTSDNPHKVTVAPKPTASFTGNPTTGPAPVTVSFSDSSTGTLTSWTWSFGDGRSSTESNPKHTYDTPGSYTVTLTVTGPGGSDVKTLSDYITVGYPKVVADFSGIPLTGTLPLAVRFSDSSLNTISKWAWQFGEGTISSERNPTHSFDNPGSYDVTLTVTGPAGTDTKTRAGHVTAKYPAPSADFIGSPSSGTAPLNVQFTDLSTGNITGWAWDFGDGATSTDKNAAHTYANPGTYTVSLKVTGPGGSNIMTRSNSIVVNHPKPVAGFSAAPTKGTAPLSIAFTDTSTGKIVSWLWAFGDGSTDTTQSPTHQYTNPGAYTVTLTVNGPGGTDRATKADLVAVDYSKPAAAFSADPTSGKAPLTVKFTNTSTGQFSTCSWKFGDGASSSAKNPTHTYETTGTYSVSLTVIGPGVLTPGSRPTL